MAVKFEFTEAWVRDLTWAKATNAYLKDKKKQRAEIEGKLNNPDALTQLTPPQIERLQRDREKIDSLLQGDTPLPKQLTYIETPKSKTGYALALVFGAGGTKTWRGLTYKDGKAISRKIGSYPALRYSEAMKKAEEAFRNPKKGEAERAAGSFREVADRWYTDYVEHEKLRSRYELRRHLDVYILPKWGNTKLHEIGRSKVRELLTEISRKNGPAMSRSIRATIHNIMSWHEEGDDNYRSPLANVSRRRRRSKQREVTARDRTLTHDEIKAVWNAASECGMFGALVKMLLLTAQRRDKVATMKWTDINEGVWTIATEAGEKGNAGSLRLPHAALDILAEQPKIAGNPFVFAGRHGKATNAFSQGVEGIRKLLPQDMERWTLHDLRRTARTLMSDAGVRPDIAERVLGHAIPGVGGVYDRSEYFEQKADALQRLADMIENIVNPPEGNVISLRR